MAEKTRVRRSKEEIVATIDSKIAAHKASIEMLEAKKSIVLSPKTKHRKATLKNLLSIAKEQGLSEEDIANKLGIALDSTGGLL